jgi:hypothetical protein
LHTTWPQAAATFVARLARSQSAMTEQPSTMTALKSKTKSLAKPKIRRKLQKINLTKEIRYIEANTATVVFLFFMTMTVNLNLVNYITLFKTSKIMTFFAHFLLLTLRWLIYLALSQEKGVFYYFIHSHIHWIYLQLLCMYS